MKTTFTTLLLGAIFTLSVNTAFGQAAQNSVGPAPQTTQNMSTERQGGPVQTTNVNSRGWILLSSSPTFGLYKQFMGNTTVTAVGAPQAITFPGAAAWNTSNQQMYMVNQSSPFQLYTIDTTTGAWTFVVNCTGVPQSNFTGLTWDATTNTMYGVSTSITQSQIFTVNLTTGVCTPIGVPSAVCAGAIQVNAAPSGSLFSVDIVADNLYKWNKVTGVATLVGPLGVNANFGQDGHFDNSDGTYYWAGYTTGPELRTIDTLTGASTLLIGTYTAQVTTLAIRNAPPCLNTTFTQTLSGCPGFTVTVGTNVYATTGVYTDVLVNSGGCDSTVTTNLTINSLPTVTATAANGTICDGSNDTITAGGANTYVWDNTATTTSIIVNPSTSVTYTVTGTDANGCVNTATVSVTVNALPVVTASSTIGTVCDGSNDTLVAGGASSYVWDNSSTNDSIVVTPSTTTTYTVTGTDANGCVNTATATVTVNALPTVTATSSIGTICDGSSDTLVAGGAAAYVWDNTATTDTIVVAPNATTTYTVTGTDANGCVNTATATVTVNALPVVTLTLGQDTACQSAGTITLNGETPAGGTWSGTAVTGNTFDPILSGVGMFGITYMYTDVNGCSSSAVDSIMVDICSGIAATSNTNGVVLFPNPNDGKFTIQLSAAPVAPVQVEVINGLGQVVIAFTMVGTTKEVDMNNLSEGSYFVRTINGDAINVQRIMKK